MSAPGTGGDARRLLLVDDTDATRELVRLLLARAGHEVTACSSGADGLAAFRARPFDLVFMDVEMPGMDGLETTAALRAVELERGAPHTPVVALTGHTGPEDQARFRDGGMDHYLAKPFRAAALYDVVDRALSASAPREDRLFDREALRRLSMGDLELEQAAADLYREHWPGQVAALRAAVAAGDEAALRRTAHRLKGAVGHFGAAPIVAGALRLEELHLPADTARATEAVDELEALLLRLQDELRP